jgi:hypothetical protein
MDYYKKYIKYKSKYFNLKYQKYQNLQGGGNILDIIDTMDIMEEKIKNNITITETLIYNLSNISFKQKSQILTIALKYNHEELIKLLS